MGLQDFTVYDMIARNARIFAHREAWVADQKSPSLVDLYNNINILEYHFETAG
jgi:hypothetical protein